MSTVLKAPKKKDRIDVRVDPSIKQIIQQAASLTGQEVTDFVISNAVLKAHEIIAQYQLISLSNTERDFFLSILEKDVEPSERSLKAATQYREGKMIGEEYHW